MKIWIALAESEARANMMGILVREGIAVNEVEEFELGIIEKAEILSKNRICL